MTTIPVPEWEPQFNKAVRHAHDVGATVVTQDGEEVAVVVDMHEYRKLTGQEMDFKQFLMTMPLTDELEIHRPTEPVQTIDLSD